MKDEVRNVASLLALAPVGSRWQWNLDAEKVNVCTGLHEGWSDPADWSPGVQIVPVVWLENEKDSADRGTVSEDDLREHYTRIVEEATVVNEGRSAGELEWSFLYTNGVRTICTGEEEARRIEASAIGVVQWRTKWKKSSAEETIVVKIGLKPYQLTDGGLRALPIGALVLYGTDEYPARCRGVVVSSAKEGEGHPVIKSENGGLFSAFDLPPDVHVYAERRGQ